MLYERWRQIASEHRNETALYDLGRGERWTFSQLAAVAESADASESIIFPQGPQFIPALLGAWRCGKVVCPLEAEQTPPVIGKFPAGCIHLKTTSATTGAPRLIAFTAEQLAADAENI